MALRVWLPLNGTLENKGVSGITFTNNGAAIGSGGKIGQCYGFTGSQYLYSSYNFYNTTYSISAWIYSTSASATQTIICDRTAVGSGFSTFLIGGKLRIDAGGNALQWTTNYSYPINQWFHLTITYDGTNVNYYINGEFKETKAQTIASSYWGNITSIGASQANGSNYSNYLQGRLNDIRIYDHCLSLKEVKEISQGLVLHYKLNQLSQGSGHNLVTGLTSGGQTTVVNDTIVTSGQNSDTYFRINLSSALTLNKSYTMGIDAENLPDGGYFRFPIGSQNNSSAGYIDIYNGHNEAVFIANDVIVNCGTLLMMDDNTRTAWPNQCIFKNFYIYENTSVDDSSGYGNDGTVTGTLSTESDSNRYKISTHYSGSSYTDTGSGTFNWFDFSQCTLSAWIKPTASVSGWSGSIGVQHNQTAGHKGFTITDYANNFRVVTVNGSYTTIDSGKPLTVGEWHHCAAVLNGTNLKMYYDGSMVKESTVSWGSAAIATDMRFATGVDFPGSDEMFTGNYSDVRMYCTALSADDILDLYHTSANIDNEKRLHSFEFVEDDGNKVDEQGLVHSGLLSSDSDLIKLLYDKKLHIEPDGSVWAHIYHHNRPDLGSFSSTNDFANSVKIDDNRWFNATEVVNSFSSEWEFLIIYNFTQGGTVYKERWIQTKNPETAVFGDVDAADITRVTGGEYKTGTWGGLYKKNGSAYWVMNNGTNGNWWGATGSFSIYQGGIPGYGGSITTTGCNDLYIRIDRFSSTPTHASIGRGSVYIFNDFIEK